MRQHSAPFGERTREMIIDLFIGARRNNRPLGWLTAGQATASLILSLMLLPSIALLQTTVAEAATKLKVEVTGLGCHAIGSLPPHWRRCDFHVTVYSIGSGQPPLGVAVDVRTTVHTGGLGFGGAADWVCDHLGGGI